MTCFAARHFQMVDAYLKAGGRPTRWFVQSWYPYPKQMTPETAPHTMTALVKAAIERVSDGGTLNPPRGAGTSPRGTSAETSPKTQPSTGTAQGRIVLQPQAGAMQVRAQVPRLDNQAFALGIPETIGCREAMLVNFPEAKIEWQGPGCGRRGVVLAGARRAGLLHAASSCRPTITWTWR